MGVNTTDAIVLRRREFRETSLLVTLFTKDFGKINGLIKGARGARAQAGLNPQLFTLNRIVFYPRKRGDLDMVTECDLIDFFDDAKRDLERLAFASYFGELVDVVGQARQPSSELFDLLLNSLKRLSDNSSAKRTARIFEIKLLKILGLSPNLTNCVGCNKDIEWKATDRASFVLRDGGLRCKECDTGNSVTKGVLPILRGTANFIMHVERASHERVSRIKVSRPVGVQLERLMDAFIAFYVKSNLKSVDFLRKLKI